ncbi:KN motif and ankyrin repeat domain-containing protein 2 [Balearica regulorum gibbericeps]|uniref:KN motif and ankyrin repeat domain-containing protein 2 n=1 Tax=Balearica regulorum gibbericeps TaxID=100784 RepID=UPI003F5D982E
MAQVLRADAFPGEGPGGGYGGVRGSPRAGGGPRVPRSRRRAAGQCGVTAGRRSGAPPGTGDAPYSLETAYGYRLDLGFLGYVEAIEKGLTLRRVPVGRRPHRASWAASAEALGPPATPDPRVERTLRGARRRLEEEEGVPATTTTGVPVTVGSPGAAPLRLVREQMAAALGRLRELEEQVRAMPALRRRLERLQEEKRQLLDRLRRDGGCRCRCGCGCGSVDGNGDPGGFGDDIRGVDDAAGNGVGSGIAASGSGAAVPVSGPGIAPVRAAGGRRSVGVGTEGPAVPGGAGALPGRVAVLERRLRRALGELRDARARLGQRQPQPGAEEPQEDEEEEEEEEGAEGRGRHRGGGSGSSSDDSEYHEAVEGPSPPVGPQPGPPALTPRPPVTSCDAA